MPTANVRQQKKFSTVSTLRLVDTDKKYEFEYIFRNPVVSSFNWCHMIGSVSNFQGVTSVRGSTLQVFGSVYEPNDSYPVSHIQSKCHVEYGRGECEFGGQSLIMDLYLNKDAENPADS